MSKDFIVGFLDMYVFIERATSLDMREFGKDEKPFIRINKQTNHFCFEVKTTIPSLGELIRQISMYKEYTQSSLPFYVVSPDDQFIKQLVSQDIGFIRYPAGEIYDPPNWKDGYYNRSY